MHGILPLLHVHLQDAEVPAEIRQDLDRLVHGVVGRNLLLTARLLDVLTILDEEHVPVVPFKGPVLTEILYGDVSLRQFDDLDVFVRREDVLRARDALAKRGYTGGPLARSEARVFFRWENHVVLRDAGSCGLELHWAAAPRQFAVDADLDAFWARTGTISYRGLSTRVFSSEDLLILLSVHGFKHAWNRIKWVADIAELVASDHRLSWDEIESRAAAIGASRIVHVGILLAADRIGAAVPEAAERWARNDQAAVALSRFVASTYGIDRGRRLDYWQHVGFLMAGRERRSDRMRYVWRTWTRPDPEICARLPLPSGLSSFYSVIHLARFGRRVARGGVQTARALKALIPFVGYSR
jgi:hypothetical protein